MLLHCSKLKSPVQETEEVKSAAPRTLGHSSTLTWVLTTYLKNSGSTSNTSTPGILDDPSRTSWKTFASLEKSSRTRARQRVFKTNSTLAVSQDLEIMNES